MSLLKGIISAGSGAMAGYIGGKMAKEDKERQAKQDKLFETYVSAIGTMNVNPSVNPNPVIKMSDNYQPNNKKDGGMVGKDNYSKGYATGGMVGKDKEKMYADGGMIYEYDPNEFSIYCGDKMMVQKKNFKK